MKKRVIYVLSSLFPGLFTKLAYKQLTQTQVKKLRPHEIEVLDTAEQEDISFEGFSIRTYHWPGGDRSIMLMHGWEGQAGNFSDFIKPLRAAGFSIYAFDAPSHGFSSQGATSLLEFISLTHLMIRKWQPSHIISHSFGSIPITFSLSTTPDVAIDRYALITTPNKFTERIQAVASKVGIADTVKERLTRLMEDKINAIENRTDLRATDLNLEDFVQTARIEKAFIVHDLADKVIPISQAKDVNQKWPAATLKVIKGTGHFRILRTESVIEEVVDFLNS